MRVAIVSAVFPPEPVMSAQTSADIAAELARRGHQVVVFTSFPNRPAGLLMPGFKRKWRQIELRDGYQVVHCWHTLSRDSVLSSRFFENLSFGLTSAYHLFLARRFDVVYADTWPILAQLLAVFSAHIKNIPVIVTVHDIYPETLTNKGFFSDQSKIAHLVAKADTWILSQCAGILTLTEEMRDFLIRERRLSSSQVFVIPNWVDDSLFPSNLPKDGSFRKAIGISPDTFVAIFAGSLTMSAGVRLYVKVAKILVQQSRNDIIILLVGDGSARKELEREIRNSGLTNIRIIYPLNPDKVPEVLAAADVLLLSLTGTTNANAAPSKQIWYMFAGRPIVASVTEGCPAANIIKSSKSGFVLPPDDPNAIAGLLCALADDQTQLLEMGNNGREYAFTHFSKKVVLPRLVTLIETVAKKSQ